MDAVKSLNFYRLPTILEEGNVFSCVCLSACLQVGGVQ